MSPEDRTKALLPYQDDAPAHSSLYLGEREVTLTDGTVATARIYRAVRKEDYLP